MLNKYSKVPRLYIIVKYGEAQSRRDEDSVGQNETTKEKREAKDVYRRSKTITISTRVEA